MSKKNFCKKAAANLLSQSPNTFSVTFALATVASAKAAFFEHHFLP